MTIKERILQLWARWLQLVRKLGRTKADEVEMDEIKAEIKALRAEVVNHEVP